MSQSDPINETLLVIAKVLIRCAVMGFAVLFLWFGALKLAGDLAYTVHAAMVPITMEQFHVIHYSGMLLVKAMVTVFFVFPYVSIRWVLQKQGM